MTKSPEHSPTQDAEATRCVQELSERGHTLGIANDSNYYITRGGGTLEVPFRAKLAEWQGRFTHLMPCVKRHLKTRIENSKEKVLNVSERDIQILQREDIRTQLKGLRPAVEAINATETASVLWVAYATEAHAITVETPPDSANKVLDWSFDAKDLIERRRQLLPAISTTISVWQRRLVLIKPFVPKQRLGEAKEK